MLRSVALLIVVLIAAACGVGNARAQCINWSAIPGTEPVTGDRDVVRDLLVWDPDGDGPRPEVLVLAGDLTWLASTPVHNVCLYDGERFLPMGGGVPGPVISVDAIGTRLFAARNDGSIGRVSEWTGSQFVDLPGSFACVACASWERPISAVVTAGGQLCVYGGFTEIDGVPVAHFARWDGATWIPVPRWDGLPWNEPARGLALTVSKDHERTLIGDCEWTGTEFRCESCFQEGISKTCAVPFNGGSVSIVSEQVGGFAHYSMCGSIHAGGPALINRALATDREVVCIQQPQFGNSSFWSQIFVHDVTGRVTHTARFDIEPFDVIRFRGELYAAGSFNAILVGQSVTLADNIAVLRNGSWQPIQTSKPNRPVFIARFGDVMLTGEELQIAQHTYQSDDFYRYARGGWQLAQRTTDWGYLPVLTPRQRIELPDRLLVNQMFEFQSMLQQWDGERWSQVTGISPAGGTGWSRLVPRADGSIWLVPRDPAGLPLIYSHGATTPVGIESRPGRAWVEWNGVLHGEFDGCWSELGPWVWWHRLNRFLPGERIDTAEVFDGRLIVSGLLRYPGGGLTLGLAEWTGTEWRTIGGWLTDAMPSASTIERVLKYDGRFYALAKPPGFSSSLQLLRLDREGPGRGNWRLLHELGPSVVDVEVGSDGALWICGRFSEVAGIPCNQFIRLRHCYADLDCSGGVDGDDTILFFAWWDTSDSRADVNGDGEVDADDTVMFFERWEAGC